MNKNQFLFICLCLLVLGGCINKITAKKVNPLNPDADLNGVRYSLPRPFIVVTPKGDGTMEVETVYLPDPNNTYAVSGWSFLASHTLTLARETNGLLTKVNWNANNAEVAAELAKAGGQVASSKVTADAAARKAAQAKEDQLAKEREEKISAAKKERQTKFSAANAVVKAAELELELAKAEKTILESSGVPDNDPKFLAVAIRIKNAEIKLDVAKSELSELEETESSYNARILLEKKDRISSAEFPKAWGQVWYRIVEDPKARTLKLIAVEPQKAIPTQIKTP